MGLGAVLTFAWQNGRR